MKINRVIIKGIIKWNEKNRFKVELLIENPPQIHITSRFPIYGIVDIRLVITVAPQKDIWPQGSTYPRNAVSIDSKKIDTPEIQVLVRLKEL